MSFLTAHPEALLYAVGQLQTLGSAMAAESAAAATPTTGVVPAAADEVSALQATIFAAYGTLYQSVNAQAAAIHDLFVNTLGASAGSYAATESANSVATASPLSQGLSNLVGAATNAAAADPPPGSALANILDVGFGNWGSASSDMAALFGGAILPAVNETGVPVGDVAGLEGAALAGATTGPTGFGTVPVMPALGQAASVGGLSVPPSWAAGPATVASPVTTAGWTAPAAHNAPATAVPAGVPAMATAGKAGGLGAPRYGVRPTVMGRPPGV